MAVKPAVSADALLDAIAHPRRAEIDRVRSRLLGLDARVWESWKWNAPNCALGGDFVTFRLQPRHAFQLILHAGADKGGPVRKPALQVPKGLLTWPAEDRCLIALDRLPAGDESERILAALACARFVRSRGPERIAAARLKAGRYRISAVGSRARARARW